MATPKSVVRLELTPTDQNALNELTDKSGMTQVALLTRLVEWCAEQPEVVKSAVLGDPAYLADIDWRNSEK
jgi:hypothetical protein